MKRMAGHGIALRLRHLLNHFVPAAVVFLASCGDDREPPRRLLDVVAPPAGLIAHCRDSLKTVRAAGLVCSAANSSSQWFVRLDGSGRVGTMSRFTPVGQGRVAAAVDSVRTAAQERLGNGKACHADAVHYWQRPRWVTFLSVQGSDLAPSAGDTMMTLVVGVSRDPTSKPWPECDE